MKRFVFGWLLAAMLLAAGAVRAEEAKADDKAKAPEVKANEETKIGTLGDKPAGAAADVVAVLKIQTEAAGGGKKGKREDGGGKKKGKHGDVAGGVEKTLNLSATGEVAAKLTDLAKRSAYVQVSGAITGDTMKVTSVFETERTVAGEKKGGKGKKNK